MTRRLIIGAIAILSVLGLVLVTLQSSPPSTGATQDEREAATRECQRSVRAELAEARFPFAPRFEGASNGALHLSGTVESGEGIQAQRRNYDCYLSPHPERTGYVADSVHVWQSH